MGHMCLRTWSVTHTHKIHQTPTCCTKSRGIAVFSKRGNICSDSICTSVLQSVSSVGTVGFNTFHLETRLASVDLRKTENIQRNICRDHVRPNLRKASSTLPLTCVGLHNHLMIARGLLIGNQSLFRCRHYCRHVRIRRWCFRLHG